MSVHKHGTTGPGCAGTCCLKATDLGVSFGGEEVLRDVSFHLHCGEIVALIGPNGAGKSTTMNIMTGCLSATEGSVKIDGYDIFEDAGKAKKLIGYLPEQPPLYMNETPMEYLRFVGEAKGLHGAELESQIEEVIRQTKIGDVKGRRISFAFKGLQAARRNRASAAGQSEGHRP